MVCVKFPAQSVDETYLRKLTEPFGKIVRILMFPSLVSPRGLSHTTEHLYSLTQHVTAVCCFYHSFLCFIYSHLQSFLFLLSKKSNESLVTDDICCKLLQAFVELGSVDQAKDLVKFHVNYPPTVNGEQIEFSISSTFNFLQVETQHRNTSDPRQTGLTDRDRYASAQGADEVVAELHVSVFLQSSRVVSFTPAPTGEDGRSDLISIIKRFGPPLYTLFLPSKVRSTNL